VTTFLVTFGIILFALLAVLKTRHVIVHAAMNLVQHGVEEVCERSPGTMFVLVLVFAWGMFLGAVVGL